MLATVKSSDGKIMSAHIGCREYSIPLQTAITDFGADVPLNKINSKLKEH